MARDVGEARRMRERMFHDEWAAPLDPASVPVEQTFTGSTTPTQRWLAERIGDFARRAPAGHRQRLRGGLRVVR